MRENEGRPKQKTHHDIGQDLSLLSVEEIAGRITLLTEEIARLTADMEKKRSLRTAAEAFFKYDDLNNKALNANILHLREFFGGFTLH